MFDLLSKKKIEKMEEEKLRLIYNRIRKFRHEKGYSQQNVADILKVSQNAYYKIENGQTKLLVSTLFALAEIFEVSLCDFLVDIK